MTRYVSVRFLIGLTDKDGNKLDLLLAARDVLAYASTVFRVGNLAHGTGLWEGKKEDSFTLETIQEDSEMLRATARSLAGSLATKLNQEAIGLVFAPVDFELVGQVKGSVL